MRNFEKAYVGEILKLAGLSTKLYSVMITINGMLIIKAEYVSTKGILAVKAYLTIPRTRSISTL